MENYLDDLLGEHHDLSTWCKESNQRAEELREILKNPHLKNIPLFESKANEALEEHLLCMRLIDELEIMTPTKNSILYN